MLQSAQRRWMVHYCTLYESTTTFQSCILHRGWCGTRHLSHPLGSCWWVPIEAVLLRRDNCNGEKLSEISPMKVWGQSVQGRQERGGPSILLYWIQKPTIVTVGLCCFFHAWAGGLSFWAFQKRWQWLDVENICRETPGAHGRGAPCWPVHLRKYNPTPFILPSLMNAWMRECPNRPFRGQSPQEFSLAQTHPEIGNTFA